MNRRYRLSKSTDFKRVRRTGKSYAHPFVVLIAKENKCHQLRIGVSAGKTVGNAVQRNRAKRRLRESIRTYIPCIQPEWDVILIARKGIVDADWSELQQAVGSLLERSKILVKSQ